MVTHLSIAFTGMVTLEASEPDARSLPPADGVEVPLSHDVDIIPADLPSSSNAPTLPALGLPLFLSNLQVSQLLLFYCSYWQTSFFAYLSMIIGFYWQCICLIEICGGPTPNPASSLMQWNPLLLQKQIDDLEVLGSCFGTPKVSHEEAASAKVVSKRWPKVPFHGASAF
jgi:hypothetical protein